MYGTHALHARLVDALQSPDPQLQVRVYGILHQHGHFYASHAVRQSLHGKRVGGGTGTYPEDVDPVLHGQLHVLGRGHLGGGQHARLPLHFLHPGQGLLSIALKASGLGAGLPYASAENVASGRGQLPGGGHHLLFCLGGAGSGDDT